MTSTTADSRQANLFPELEPPASTKLNRAPSWKASRVKLARIEAEREAFREEYGIYPLRQWLYPKTGPYNGFTGDERIRGWQVTRWFVDNGWLERPHVCSVTGATSNVVGHNENYYEPWRPFAITRKVHMALHQRFRRPAWWKKIVRENTQTGEEWYCDLSMDRSNDLGSGLITSSIR